MVKDEIYDLANKLRVSTSTDGGYTRRLVKLLLDQAKDRLVSATDANELMRVQGEARLLDKIYKQLTVAPPNSTE